MVGHQYEGTTVANSSNTVLGDTNVNNYYAGEPDDTRCLKVAKGAVFDDRENERGPLCHPQTRKRLLRQVAQWADDPEGKCIFWLRGAAGTGKSTISRTVAKNFSDEGKLAASFFFNRTIDDCSKADLFVTTIANQLVRNVHGARNIQGLKDLIQNAIRKNPDLPSKTLKTQFAELIVGPLKELGAVGSPTATLMLAIDALDECDIEDYTGAGPYLERTRMIVGLLGELASVTGTRVRIFITSRPELPIQLGFKHDVPENIHQDIALHNIPPSEIEHDIRAYLEYELKRMQTFYNIIPPWPDSDTITVLVHRCSPLFIYAATTCRFMDNRRFHPKTQLKKILGSGYRPTNKMEMTYGTVLDQLVFGLDECDRQDVIGRFRKIVGGIILLADPLPVASLARLFDDTEDEVFLHLKNLHSVLSIPEDPNSDQPIKVFHLSFPEYLLDRNGEKSQFSIEEQQTHTDLLDCCLRVMTNRNQHCLKNDICHLEDPGVLREEVAPENIRENIPPHLKYACIYWVHHLGKAHCPTNETKVYDFLTRFFVQWLEAMSWLGRIEQSVNDIGKLQTMFNSPSSKIASFLEDAGRFVVEHKYTIDRAPCQVYVSALLFSPTDSIVKQSFRSEIPWWVLRAPEIAKTWNVGERSLQKYTSKVMGMCYSHDGVYLAIATKYEVDILHTDSGTLCATTNDFTSEVSCLVFRAMNNIAVGLVSGSVVFWDWIHGQQSIKNLSESCIVYMSSSANGDLVCGFNDGGVYLWKENLGVLHRWKTCWRPRYDDLDRQLFSGPVTGISYSFDGRFVAIIRDRCSNYVDVYDASSGYYVHGICAPRESSFGSLAILPNNLLLAISGPREIGKWNLCRLLQAEQIQLWDLNANMETPVEEVSFISRGYMRPTMSRSRILCLQRLSSCLDIWDMRETPVLMWSSPSVELSCFSPDERYIAVSASNGHIAIIDTLYLLTNNENAEGFQLSRPNHESIIWSQSTCSPDGSRLGTISSHGRVVVWNLTNGQVVPKLLNPINPLLKGEQHNLALSWSVDGTSLVVVMPDGLNVYPLLSGQESTQDKYPLDLTADEASKSVIVDSCLCCSTRGSYLAMGCRLFNGQEKIVMWKWDDRSLKDFWIMDLATASERGRPYYLAFSLDEMWLACLASGEHLILMNVEFGSIKWETKLDISWNPQVLAFDSAGSQVVVGACNNGYDYYNYQDGTDEEMDDERNEPASYVAIFSIHDGGRLLHSESIRGWGREHAKSFSVGFIGTAPINVEPQHWLRLKEMAEQVDPHPPANGFSCHVYVRHFGFDRWVMKGDRRKVLLPGSLGYNVIANNRSSLPHRLFGNIRDGGEMPWLIELDCRDCIFPGNFLEMRSGNCGGG